MLDNLKRRLLGSSSSAGKGGRKKVFAKPPFAKNSKSKSDNEGVANHCNIKEGALSNQNSSSDNESAWVLKDSDDGLWIPDTKTAFKALVSARICSAFWSGIGDCDETFNYWEPTHYLIYGNGFQTWEYSPQYAIRSYAYLLAQVLFGKIYSTILVDNKIFVFYFIRILFAMISASAETLFYRSVIRIYGGHIARIMLAFLAMSPGMFVSGIAYLPSTFAMHFIMFAMSAWHYEKHDLAIGCVALAAILGWPFAALLGIPIAADLSFRVLGVRKFLTKSVLTGLIISITVFNIDKVFYGRGVFPTLNILLYNMFTSHGANLYGTEPWYFYLLNLLLNFNIVFSLAVASLVLVPMAVFGYLPSPIAWFDLRKENAWIPVLTTVFTPFLWLFIFTSMQHKEERFLVPIYPQLCFLAALSLDLLQRLVAKLRHVRISTYRDFTMRSVVLLLLMFACLSFSRMFALYKNYHAPVDTFMGLMTIEEQSLVGVKKNLCIGKEWYRFPSSFFLPDATWNLRFIESDFNGLLPRQFDVNGTRGIANGFNDMNRAAEDQYFTPIEDCDYLVYIDKQGVESSLEPRYVLDNSTWKVVSSLKFLYAPTSNRIFRAFYIPFVSEIMCQYGDYLLLQNVKKHGVV